MIIKKLKKMILFGSILMEYLFDGRMEMIN